MSYRLAGLGVGFTGALAVVEIGANIPMWVALAAGGLAVVFGGAIMLGQFPVETTDSD